MQKNGKKFLNFYSKISSPSASEPTSVVSFSRHGFSKSTIDHRIEFATAVIMRWSTESSAYAEVTSMFYENKQEAFRFIKCVNDLQKFMHFLAENSATASEKLKFCHNLMQIAMKRLRIEFYRILSVNRELYDAAESCSGDANSEVKTVSYVAMADLKAISECMISSGYAKECVEIYKTVRKSIIDEGLYDLGIEKLPSPIHKIHLEELELRIKKWSKSVNIAITKLFNAERVLCDRVFADSESVKESCFTNTCKEGAMLLFTFPEMIVKSKKSQKNIFRLLEMFKIISENWTEIESIFSFESTEAVRSQAPTSLGVLAESIFTMLSDFESSIIKERDSSNSLPADRGIHVLVLQSMDYISLLAEYRENLSMILTWRKLPENSSNSLPDSYFNTSDSDESSSPAVSSIIARLIFVLLCKLDRKSRQYDDVSLSYLFLANNVRHVLVKVQNSKLQYLLGEGWIANHESKVNRYIDGYKRLGWDKVISSLPENPTADLSTAEVAAVYDNFNFAFKESYRKQRLSVVSDTKLRDGILSSIGESLLPAYREFYHAYRIPVREEVCARFTPEDIENYLSYLFLPRVNVQFTAAAASSSSSSSFSFCEIETNSSEAEHY